MKTVLSALLALCLLSLLVVFTRAMLVPKPASSPARNSVAAAAQATGTMAQPICRNAPQRSVPDADFVVSSETQLQDAVSQLRDGQTIVIESGTYALTRTLVIARSDVSLIGNSSRCDDVVLRGPGMENDQFGDTPHGLWINGARVAVRNLALSDFYHHAITFGQLAAEPELYNLRLRDAGEQFVKVSDFGDGSSVDGGRVQYSVIHYSKAPPDTDHGGGTGYTNGIDVHVGAGWQISHNYFGNLHTPDDADHLWNAAVLMWNGARNTIVEGNLFSDVDRAIAFGLSSRNRDHLGGVIRNNMIHYSEGLMSSARAADSDAAIIVWNSPQTIVAHNTVVSNGNVKHAIEFRFDTAGARAVNNLSDRGINVREGGSFDDQSNRQISDVRLFTNPQIADLRLREPLLDTRALTLLPIASEDIDGQNRATVEFIQPGAHQR